MRKISNDLFLIFKSLAVAVKVNLHNFNISDLLTKKWRMKETRGAHAKCVICAKGTLKNIQS